MLRHPPFFGVDTSSNIIGHIDTCPHFILVKSHMVPDSYAFGLTARPKHCQHQDLIVDRCWNQQGLHGTEGRRCLLPRAPSHLTIHSPRPRLPEMTRPSTPSLSRKRTTLSLAQTAAACSRRVPPSKAARASSSKMMVSFLQGFSLSAWAFKTVAEKNDNITPCSLKRTHRSLHSRHPCRGGRCGQGLHPPLSVLHEPLYLRQTRGCVSTLHPSTGASPIACSHLARQPLTAPHPVSKNQSS